MLAERITHLSQLVEGHEKWSHRTRLHALEGADRGVELAAAALKAYREQRNNVWTRVREWGGFAVAVAAIAVAWWS